MGWAMDAGDLAGLAVLAALVVAFWRLVSDPSGPSDDTREAEARVGDAWRARLRAVEAAEEEHREASEERARVEEAGGDPSRLADEVNRRMRGDK